MIVMQDWCNVVSGMGTGEPAGSGVLDIILNSSLLRIWHICFPTGPGAYHIQ